MRTDSWAFRPFGEVSENLDAVRIPVKESERKSGPYPYYGASGIVDYVNSYLFDGEYLLVAEDGENLRTQQTPIAFLARGKFWVNNHAHIVRGNTLSDTRFLMYALRMAEVRAYLTGSTMPKLTQANLNRIPIPSPPLSAQRPIAHILGTLDDKIDLNRRMNETLEAMARAIFKSWFVDFDPVRAKAEGRQPAGMDAETAALFPDGFEDSALGKIPKGWKVGKLSEEVTLIGGGTPKTTEPSFWGGDIPWFSVVDAPRDTDVWVTETEKHITQAGLENSSTKILQTLTTIITARGTVGKCALVGTPMAMNQSCYGLAPTAAGSQRYLFFNVREHVVDLQQGAHGSVFDTITRESFSAVPSVIPSTAATHGFDLAVAPFLDRMLANLKESRTLAAIRDALLPKLLSGEIRVGEHIAAKEASI